MTELFPELGQYEHYKNKEIVTVLGKATMKDTANDGDPVVLYVADDYFYVRPPSRFMATVDIMMPSCPKPVATVPRFKKIKYRFEVKDKLTIIDNKQGCKVLVTSTEEELVRCLCEDMNGRWK